MPSLVPIRLSPGSPGVVFVLSDLEVSPLSVGVEHMEFRDRCATGNNGICISSQCADIDGQYSYGGAWRMGFESSFVGACLVLGKRSMVGLVWRLVPSVNLRKAVA